MNNQALASCLKWGQKYNRQLIFISVVTVMGITLSLQGYEIYRTLSENNPDTDDQPISSQTQQPSFKADDFALIFGRNDRPEVPSKSADIPKTRLNLVLRGALSGKQHQPESSAIIQGNSQEKLYSIGDTLPGGATLSEVHADHVVLMRGGQPETLFFPELSKESGGLSPYKRPDNELQPHTKPRADYTKQPDSDSLEDRMRKLKEQLQQANQGSP